MKNPHTLLARVPAGSRLGRGIRPVVFGLLVAVASLQAQSLPGPWQTQDVGSVGAAGSASFGSGTFTVTGAGAEVYNATDAFRYVYQAVSGDCTIVARVATEQNTSQWAKVGLMVRESLASDAAYSFVFLTPDQTSGTDRGILFESRASTGATSTQTANLPGYIAPYWLKLVRAGNTFTASRSSDGATWTTVGTQTLTFTSSVLVGLVVCSHADPTLNTSTFDNVSVTNGLPSPWSTWDVGATGATGGASYGGSTFTVNGAGGEVYYTSDAFRYVYQPISGDSTVTVRVASEQNTNQWAKVGIMFRETLTDNSAYSFVFITPDQTSGTDRGILFESRASAGASATQTAALAGYIAPYWLRLERSGNTFTASISSDGVSWTSIGSQTLSLAANLYAGLAVCSHVSGTLNTSTFDNVSVGAPAWTDTDVGSPLPAGSSSLSGGTFTVNGAGAETYGTSDEFHYVSRPFTGDCTITARIATEQNTSQWAKVGLMLRESTAANAAYSFVFLTPDQTSGTDRGILFESRASTGASSTQTSNLPGYIAPYWLRLSRSGDTFTAFRSSDGVVWTTVGTQTLSLASTLDVGLVVCSHAAGVLNTSTFDNVLVEAGGMTGGGYKTTFPRLAGINFGAKNYEDTTYEANLAKLDLIILGFYKGWTHGTTIRTVVQNIKALHPGILVGNYTLMESELNPATSSDADYDIYTKLNGGVGPTGNGGTWTPNDWWAHNTSGGLLNHSGYTAQKLVNITEFTTPDSAGQRFPQWFAQRSYDAFFSPVPEFDVWFIDNVFYRPRESGVDWKRRGTGDDQNDETVRTYFRQGNVDYVAAIQALKPGMLVMGNIDGDSHASPAQGWLREAQYGGIFAGAFQESAAGRSFSEETQYTNGWDVMMSSYRSLMDHTIAPHLVIFNVKGAAPANATAADYAVFRYLFASALMEDGYFSYSEEDPAGSGKYPYSGVSWFDEYDLAGTSDTNWLGTAVDPKQRMPKSNGVYIRRFEHGMAITNPKGNGTQMINLATLFPGETYKRITGTQDSTTNNGATVTSLTIGARDGLILVKQ
ncbi:MAG TPA: putative glycoside hydrolase [Opitutus sp.]|nr:putative glycoside hydrolase [Opitutus sp.]